MASGDGGIASERGDDGGALADVWRGLVPGAASDGAAHRLKGVTRHPLQGGVCKRRDCVRERVVAQALALNQRAKKQETLAYVNSLT